MTKARMSDQRREDILRTASEIFLSQGFSGASMSRIAAAVGGSKGTLYSYYPGKSDLFEACVQRLCAQELEAGQRLPQEGPELRATLIRFGQDYLGGILSDPSLRLRRLVVAEAERSPEVGRIYDRTGRTPVRAALQRLLAGPPVPAIPGLRDPERAADHLLALLQDRLLHARMCNLAPAPCPRVTAAEATEAVDIFLRAA